jgi:hypothetical protein
MIGPMLVRCLPGVDRTVLLSLLRQQHMAVVNVRGTPQLGWTGSFSRLVEYLFWASDTARLLGGLIGSEDVDRLVFTGGYRLLLSSADVLEGRYFDRVLENMVMLELDQRVKAFDEVIAQLDRLIERWSRPGVFVVPDTSFFIKDTTKLEERDIASSLGVSDEPIHLIVPIAVVDELDKTKADRLRGPAQRTLAAFERVLVKPTEPGVLQDAAELSGKVGAPRGEVSIELLLDRPGHVRMSIIDDEIIDRGQAVKPLADREITVLTYDTGMAMRARAANLRAVKLRVPEDTST